MATNLQRWTAICDALVNGTATDAQKLRLGRAVAWKDGRLEEFDAGTNAQKLEISVHGIQRLAVNLVRVFEGESAGSAAHAAAVAAVGNDFPDA
jgi:hypothetical protein